jgi:hypothetical protein
MLLMQRSCSCDTDIVGLIWEEKSVGTEEKPKLMGIIGRDILLDLKLHIDGRKSQGFLDK